MSTWVHKYMSMPILSRSQDGDLWHEPSPQPLPACLLPGLQRRLPTKEFYRNWNSNFFVAIKILKKCWLLFLKPLQDCSWIHVFLDCLHHRWNHEDCLPAQRCPPQHLLLPPVLHHHEPGLDWPVQRQGTVQYSTVQYRDKACLNRMSDNLIKHKYFSESGYNISVDVPIPSGCTSLCRLYTGMANLPLNI